MHTWRKCLLGLIVVLFAFLTLSACGGSNDGGTSGSGSSNWGEMVWDKDNWG